MAPVPAETPSAPAVSCEVDMVVAVSPFTDVDKLVNVTVFTFIRTYGIVTQQRVD